MQQKRVVQTNEFKVQDSAGKIYTVIEITNQIQTTFVDNTNTGWMDASKQYRVKGGGPVNKLKDSQFEILDTDQIATLV